MIKWPRSSILLAVALVLTRAAVHAIVIIPSSQYQMDLRPTFDTMTLESVVRLQASMEQILMQTTQDIHRESIQPKAVNVVIQAHELGSASDISVTTDSSFHLPTTVATFVVLGNFDQVTSSMGTAFMDSLVSQTFTRAIFKASFIASLKNSLDQALMHVIDASIEKLDSDAQIINSVVADPTDNDSSDKSNGLTAVDISLITVSSMIFIAIVFVVVQASKDKKTKQLPRSSSSREKKKCSSPAIKENLSGVPSFDESTTSSQAAHLQIVPDTSYSDTALPEQSLNPHFRILRHSPPAGTRAKTVIAVIEADEEEEGSFSTMHNQEKEIMTVLSLPSSMISGAPGGVSLSGESSSASDASLASSRFPASLGSLSGHFSSSKWFEGSANSFSVGSQDIFGVGLENSKPKQYDGGISTKSHCSTISSANSTSLVEWARTIRVIASDNGSSVATPASAPEGHYNFNHDSDSGGFADGFETI